MTHNDFTAALAADWPEPPLRVLTQRFNHAFRRTRALRAGMAAVNEMLDRPLTYNELLSRLQREDVTGGR